jgi:putative tricarboxylic transport membrane protein
MPGLGSVNGVAILLPITFLVPPSGAIIFLAAIYYGAMYGGAISSVTLGIPGASTAVATTFDGRPLASRAVRASHWSRRRWPPSSAARWPTSSSRPSRRFWPRGAQLRPARDLRADAAGLRHLRRPRRRRHPQDHLLDLLRPGAGAIGFDQISGAPRLVLFDITGFLQGIGFLVLAIGVYGIGEMLWTIEQSRGEVDTTTPKMTMKGLAADTAEATRRGWKGTAIGSVLGFFVGILPAAGATPASLMSYGVAKMVSRSPKEFGKGNPDGVAAPEAANNSASTGSMLPMLTLGIPGSPTTAILLGGMVIWGLTPGPRLFVAGDEFVWGLIGSFYISNVAAVLINLAFIPVFIWMLGCRSRSSRR